jgi:hypothetical protein
MTVSRPSLYRRRLVWVGGVGGRGTEARDFYAGSRKMPQTVYFVPLER